MSELSGALCVGRHTLFESTDLRDHEDAAAICAECPARTACAELAAASPPSVTFYGIQGTWAGHLYPDGSHARRGRRNPREHGTERGYQQHRHTGEDQCDPCRRAHNGTFAKWFGEASA